MLRGIGLLPPQPGEVAIQSSVRGPIYGVVADEAGRPAGGVTVTAFTNNGKPDPNFLTSVPLKATVLPAGADSSVIWTVSDSSVVGVDRDGVVTAKAVTKKSAATVTATSTRNPALSASCTVTVEAKASIDLGVE